MNVTLTIEKFEAPLNIIDFPPKRTVRTKPHPISGLCERIIVNLIEPAFIK